MLLELDNFFISDPCYISCWKKTSILTSLYSFQRAILSIVTQNWQQILWTISQIVFFYQIVLMLVTLNWSQRVDIVYFVVEFTCKNTCGKRYWTLYQEIPKSRAFLLKVKPIWMHLDKLLKFYAEQEY